MQEWHIQDKSLVVKKKLTIFLGSIHDSMRSSHCWLSMHFTGEVFLTECRGKGSKYFFLSLCRCWRTANFIISRQPFLTTGSLLSTSNFAYSEWKTCIYIYIYDNGQLDKWPCLPLLAVGPWAAAVQQATSYQQQPNPQKHSKAQVHKIGGGGMIGSMYLLGSTP